MEVLKNRDGKSKGVAVVELATKEGANKTIDVLHRKVVGGRTLSAKEIRVWICFSFRSCRVQTWGDHLSYLEHSGQRLLITSPST